MKILSLLVVSVTEHGIEEKRPWCRTNTNPIYIKEYGRVNGTPLSFIICSALHKVSKTYFMLND